MPSMKVVHAWLYVDGIFILGLTEKSTRTVVGIIINKLKASRFIISEKSEPEPVCRLQFIGKVIDVDHSACACTNNVCGLRSAMQPWIRGTRKGRRSTRLMRRLLG